MGTHNPKIRFEKTKKELIIKKATFMNKLLNGPKNKFYYANYKDWINELNEAKKEYEKITGEDLVI